jgi:XRE family transcriptional regulator, aerobic/anaerobic benzoate catabolism transcriptional regulator
LRSREPLYAKAEVALSTSGRTPEQNLAELLRLIEVPDNRITRRSATTEKSKEPATAGIRDE